MTKIKFGTDGWRAIIVKEYTEENVARVSIGTADWLIKNFDKPSIVIGHDCRYGGALFTETAIKVFISKGIKVIVNPGALDLKNEQEGKPNHQASHRCHLHIV